MWYSFPPSPLHLFLHSLLRDFGLEINGRAHGSARGAMVGSSGPGERVRLSICPAAHSQPPITRFVKREAREVKEGGLIRVCGRIEKWRSRNTVYHYVVVFAFAFAEGVVLGRILFWPFFLECGMSLLFSRKQE